LAFPLDNNSSSAEILVKKNKVDEKVYLQSLLIITKKETAGGDRHGKKRI